MTGGVYLVGDPERGPKKIGISANYQARLTHIRHYAPFKVWLLNTWDMPQDAAYAVEQTAHAMLWDCLAHGEWFHTDIAEAWRTVDLAEQLVDGRCWQQFRFEERMPPFDGSEWRA